MRVVLQHDLTAPQLAQIEQEWRALLAQTGNRNVFASWPWHAATLHIALPHLACVRFFRDESEASLVGMAFLGKQTKRHWGVATEYGYLNQTGITELDQQWIEYNDILTSKADAHACRVALLKHLIVAKLVDVLVVRSTSDDSPLWLGDASQHNDLALFIEQERVAAYKAQLPALNADKLDAFNDILARYSSNTRSQIRRAIKYIEQQYGQINMQCLQGEAIAAEYTSMQTLHAKRWRDSEYGSGFDNPAFNAFHRELWRHQAEQHFDVQVLKFSTPTLLLGFLYNFVCDGHVYFYVSAINYADKHNKFKAGLVMHALAQTHYAQRGCHTYDFMGGECRYKASLSSEQYGFYHTYLHCNPVKQQLYRSAKRVKALLS